MNTRAAVDFLFKKFLVESNDNVTHMNYYAAYFLYMLTLHLQEIEHQLYKRLQ